MNLESTKVLVEHDAQYVFEQLSDVKNFEKLMPDTIAKFEVTDENSFLFGLKGMPEIKLRIKEKTAPNKILLVAASDKLPFSLEARIDSIAADQAEVQLLFSGEFNAMMAMMVKGPIGKFIETLSANMRKL